MQQRQRDRLRLTGLAALSAGVAFLLIFLTRGDHPLATLFLAVICLFVSVMNFGLLRR